jgi:SAM-dependent methyltransferase
MRVLEIGCGPGAAAREIARRIGRGHVLGIDRSATAIAQAKARSRAEIASGVLSFRQAAIEDFELEAGEAPYDIALAVRVGALDGRHPHAESASEAPDCRRSDAARTTVHRWRQSPPRKSIGRMNTLPARQHERNRQEHKRRGE